MKAKFLLIMVSMLLCSAGVAFGQSVSIDHIDGLNESGPVPYLEMNTPIKYYIRMTGDGDAHGGITNGFEIASPDGANWGAVVADTVGIGKAFFDGGFFISELTSTHADGDTVGFGGFRFFGTGLPAGYDDIAYTIDIGSLPESEYQKNICFDSAFYPPSGVWKWAGVDVFPGWDGPHCYVIGEPEPEVPTILSITPATATQCQTLSVTITGENTAFGQTTPTAALISGATNIIGYNVSAPTDTTLLATFDIPSDAPLGDYDVYADGITNGGEGLFTVTAPEAKNIVLSETSLTFDAFEGSYSIMPQDVNISSDYLCEYDYTVATDEAWLTVDPTSGTTEGIVSVTANPTGVPAGMYTATVTVTAAGALNSPQEIAVTMNIDPNPGPNMSANVVASHAAGPVDGLTMFGLDSGATDGYDAGIDEFEPPTPPGNYVRTYFEHAEWNQMQDLYERDIRWPTSAFCKEFILTVETNALDEITLNLANVINPGYYAVRLLDMGGTELVADFLAEGYDFTATEMMTNFKIEVCAGACPDVIITCPGAPLDVGVCAGEQVCVDLPIAGQDLVEVASASWADGQLCFNPGADGQYVFDVAASNSCGNSDACQVTVNVTLTNAPAITCPTDPIVAEICIPQTVCIPLVITDAGEVTSTQGGVWANDEICWDVPGSIDVVDTVIATNACGADTCIIPVTVTLLPAVAIECPEGDLAIEICAGNQACVPLVIDNATEVVVEGATWADGILCFDAPATDAYPFSVTASNTCGEEVCDFTVNVTVNTTPVIDCPQANIVQQVSAEEVCVPLAITGADDVSLTTVPEGWTASWVDGNFCFDASTIGVYTVQLTATNACGSEVCDVTVEVVECPMPTIACPPDTMFYDVCEIAEICITLAITDFDEVNVGTGAWEADEFCFTPAEEGTFPITVSATNGCGTVECELVFVVNLVDDPVINVPSPAPELTVCGPQELCFPLVIDNALEVQVTDGVWADGQLCFQADTAGSYAFTVMAIGECTEVEATVEALVLFYAEPTAGFTADPDGGSMPLEVMFTNTSVVDALDSYFWDFDDGSTSDMENPIHTFEGMGCFDVSLTVYHICGYTDTYMQTICVTDSQIVVPTDRWINIYCGAPLLEGSPLEENDIITAYDPDGVLCGLDMVKPDGSFGLMPIYADDIYTIEDEGAVEGDMITLKINGVAVATTPIIYWTENGDPFEICEFTAEECLTFDLDAGWHLISWNVAYTDDVADAIADFAECVDVVLSFDRGGLTYDPSLPEFSTLADVDFYHGYWLRLSCPVTFEICGGLISPFDGIEIYSGWNLVSYWPDEVMPVTDGFASIMDNLEVAYGYDDGAMDYIPGDPIHNTLTDLAPGFGYWVKSAADDLLYYGDVPVAAPRVDERPMAASYGVTASRTWMSIYGAGITLDGSELVSGSNIQVVTDDGTICGSGVYSGGLLKFTPVYGYDNVNAVTEDYPKVGDELTIVVNGEEVSQTLTWESNGARAKLDNLTTSAGQMPESFGLSQNYPNPFNPSTAISFNLPVAGFAELSVFNILGQKVITLVSGNMSAGNHEVTWEGTDETGSTVTSGVYFYRLTTEQNSETRKMMLMK